MKEHGLPRADAAAYWLLAVLTLFYVVSMVDRQVIGLLVPDIKAALAISDLQISLLAGASFAIFYCLAGVPIGWLVDNYSRRMLIAGGVELWALATAACGLAGSFWGLASARVIVGVGEAVLSPAAYSMLGDKFPRRQLGMAIAIFGIGATLGSSLAYAMGGWLLGVLPKSGIATVFGELDNWQVIFLIAALPAFILAPLLFTIREPKRQSVAPNGQQRGFGTALRFMKERGRFFTSLFVGNGLLLICSPHGYLRRSIVRWGPRWKALLS